MIDGKFVMRWNKRRRSSSLAFKLGLKGDMEYEWGAGVEQRVIHMFIGQLFYGCMHYDFTQKAHVTDPSFLEDLDAAGFDVSTLRISIRQKAGR